MRPEMGAVIFVYPRLIRAVANSASACLMAARAEAAAPRSL